MDETESIIGMLGKIADKKKQKQGILPPKFKNSIVHADCLDVLRDLPDSCINLVVTDPPLDLRLLDLVAPELLRVLRKGSSLYLFVGTGQDILLDESGNRTLFMSATIDLLTRCGFVLSCLLVWDRACPRRGLKYKLTGGLILRLTVGAKTASWAGSGELRKDFILDETDVLSYPKTIRKRCKDEKPSSIYRSFILDATKNYNDVVLDPFAGSGPVIEAAKDTGRVFLAIDDDESMVEIMRKRVEQITIQETIAKKEARGRLRLL